MGCRPLIFASLIAPISLTRNGNHELQSDHPGGRRRSGIVQFGNRVCAELPTSAPVKTIGTPASAKSEVVYAGAVGAAAYGAAAYAAPYAYPHAHPLCGYYPYPPCY